MKLLEPTQKYIDAYPDGIVSENRRFWFNLDLSFIVTSGVTEEIKRDNLKQYCHIYEIELSYEDLMDNFNVPFSIFIEEFKDTKIYDSFKFKG